MRVEKRGPQKGKGEREGAVVEERMGEGERELGWQAVFLHPAHTWCT